MFGPPRLSWLDRLWLAVRSLPGAIGQESEKAFTASVVLKTAEAEFSEEARHAKVSGSVNVSLVVDETGKPTDLGDAAAGSWVGGKAVEAIHGYVFQPATCHARREDTNQHQRELSDLLNPAGVRVN